MNNTKAQKAAFQGFLFNIIVFIVFMAVGIYYVIPEYGIVAAKEKLLVGTLEKYSTLKSEGISYDNFTKGHAIYGNTKEIDKDVLLTNVLKDFGKDAYNDFYVNKGKLVYDTFLKNKLKDVKQKKGELDKTGINAKVKKILPFYTADSSLITGSVIDPSVNDESLTDFMFINHLEQLLYAFHLQTDDNIGIGDLELEESFELSEKGKKKNRSSIDGKIYNGRVQLKLTGKKIHIINFIHFIDNVGKVEIIDGKVSIKERELGEFYKNIDGKDVINNFKDMGNYFRGSDNLYDNLLMEVESLEMEEYLDSSELPNDNDASLIKLAKETQGKERFEINIVIKFYVKGLPTYKIEEFIKKIGIRHSQLLSVVKSGILHIDKNKSTLTTGTAIAAITNLKNLNSYLKEVKKEIDEMKGLLIKKEKLGEAYSQALNINKVFNEVTKRLHINIGALSDELYIKHKEILGKIVMDDSEKSVEKSEK